MKTGKMLRHMFYEFLPVTQVMDYRPDDLEERELLDRQFGKWTHRIVKLFAYPYMRGTVEDRVQNNIRIITRQAKEAAREQKLTPDMLERALEKIDTQLEILEEAQEERKKPSGWKIPLGGGASRDTSKGLGMGAKEEEKTVEGIDLGRISQIESSGNPEAVSYRGAKYGRGLHQISEVALRDYNKATGEKIKPSQLFDSRVNTKVAKWYFGKLEGYLKHYNIPVTDEHLLAAYNWGIGNLKKWYEAGADPSKLPSETRGYIEKYKKG
jgi:soluble lytic murein transglycosylase-like protein